MDRPRPIWLLRHRVPILAALAVVTAAFASHLPGLRFDFSPQQMFESAQRDEAWAFYEQTLEAFGRDDDTLLVVVEADDVLRSDVRAWIAEVTAAVETLPATESVTSLANAATVRTGEGGDLEILVTADLDPAALLADPLLAGYLVSRDRRLSLILVNLEDDRRSIDVLAPAVGAVADLLAQHPPPAGVATHLAGIPFIRVDVVESLEKDQLRFAPITAGVMALFLFWTFRRLSRVVVLLFTVGIALMWALSLMAILDIPVDIVNNVLPSLILVIGVSDGLHLLVRDQQEHARGQVRIQALSIAVRTLAAACLLTSLTTAVGFASLTASRTAILQRFGIVVAAGVLFAYILTLGLLPTALSFFAAPAPVDGRRRLFADLAEACGSLALRRPWTVVFGSGALLVAAAAVGFSQVHVDARLTEVYAADHPTSVLQRTLDASLGGVLPASVVITLPEPGGHKNPAVVRAVAELQDGLAVLPEVSSARSAVDLLAALHRALAGPEGGRLPDTTEAAAQEWLLAELGERPLPLHYFIADDGRRLRVLLRVADVGGRRLLELEKIVAGLAASAFAEIEGVDVRLTGDGFMASRNLTQLITDLFVSLALASGVIFFMLLLMFRSVRTALLSVVPNALPLVVTLGAMGLVGMDLDVSNVIIFSISLGLAVDDTIHVLARFREELRHGGAIDDILRRTVRGTGPAVVLTSALLGLGMAVLVFSDFLPTQRFGALTALTLTTAVIADLVLLPALIKLAYGRRTS